MREPGRARELLDLLDWKRRIFELYAEVRATAPADPKAAWGRWRSVRDEMFRTHPQSPIPEPERPSFEAVPFFVKFARHFFRHPIFLEP